VSCSIHPRKRRLVDCIEICLLSVLTKMKSNSVILMLKQFYFNISCRPLVSSTMGLLFHSIELKPALCGKTHVHTWLPIVPDETEFTEESFHILPNTENSMKGSLSTEFSVLAHSKSGKIFQWRISFPFSDTTYASNTNSIKNSFSVIHPYKVIDHASNGVVFKSDFETDIFQV
jgi:hypothetical protein